MKEKCVNNYCPINRSCGKFLNTDSEIEVCYEFEQVEQSESDEQQWHCDNYEENYW